MASCEALSARHQDHSYKELVKVANNWLAESLYFSYPQSSSIPFPLSYNKLHSPWLH